uniref:Uncharacterized protein n=1 Tax=Chromera velia CCMP2878 TaxID=1169474 RepID=A0A0G4F2Y7_9ALVE|mmetsp:Transcript_54012/g.105635  ORF Transcript_54012/g.105635 Transcript_54012/m.105635 type:complete len:408 (+) Transcript_54012:159-1382(+)|eukprot:Cvel_2660.t1-p1 / transcript=Cvel_2660.t1 / gene=Cvel_2660 / organism=Chromera_velia_CCMP2878 / gene_product=hypothetical protein / transcript_product=hypothetical protein / location=Cvel_scaffold106:30843-32063(-) / protein_length=407 / sequence_SO=supercontig / SO=protein_coding / is_pseudo=false
MAAAPTSSSSSASSSTSAWGALRTLARGPVVFLTEHALPDPATSQTLLQGAEGASLCSKPRTMAPLGADEWIVGGRWAYRFWLVGGQYQAVTINASSLAEGSLGAPSLGPSFTTEFAPILGPREWPSTDGSVAIWDFGLLPLDPAASAWELPDFESMNLDFGNEGGVDVIPGTSIALCEADEGSAVAVLDLKTGARLTSLAPKMAPSRGGDSARVELGRGPDGFPSLSLPQHSNVIMFNSGVVLNGTTFLEIPDSSKLEALPRPLPLSVLVAQVAWLKSEFEGDRMALFRLGRLEKRITEAQDAATEAASAAPAARPMALVCARIAHLQAEELSGVRWAPGRTHALLGDLVLRLREGHGDEPEEVEVIAAVDLPKGCYEPLTRGNRIGWAAPNVLLCTRGAAVVPGL